MICHKHCKNNSGSDGFGRIEKMLVHRNNCLGLTVSQVRVEVRNRNIVVEVVLFQVPPTMVLIR